MPTGEIFATEARGVLMGNRGIIHCAGSRTLLSRRWRHQHWVCCQLQFNDRHREVWSRGSYTELFFLDEATALAAGHRPCGTCQRRKYGIFRNAWLKGNPNGLDNSIDRIDRQMHYDRVTRDGRQVRYSARMDSLPAGVMVLVDSRPCLVRDDRLLPWSEHGYETRLDRHREMVTVLTPRSTVAAMEAGYRPDLHCSAY